MPEPDTTQTVGRASARHKYSSTCEKPAFAPLGGPSIDAAWREPRPEYRVKKPSPFAGEGTRRAERGIKNPATTLFGDLQTVGQASARHKFSSTCEKSAFAPLGGPSIYAAWRAPFPCLDCATDHSTPPPCRPPYMRCHPGYERKHARNKSSSALLRAIYPYQCRHPCRYSWFQQ